MENCASDNTKLFGAAAVLELVLGCPKTTPAEADWKSVGACTSKGFDFSPNTVTSDADDQAGFVESIVTNSDFTLSLEGEVRKKDKLDEFGVGNLVHYYTNEVKNKRQPALWVRAEFGQISILGYMVITALSWDGGTNDIVTFSVEFKVSAADTMSVTYDADTGTGE